MVGLVGLVGFPMIVLVLFFYGLMFFVIFFVIWKFYQILSKINDNIAGIRQALERNDPGRASAPA
jgi:hypothetical protein